MTWGSQGSGTSYMAGDFQEGRRWKFPGQLRAPLRTDMVPFCQILLVRAVPGSTEIAEYRTKLPLLMGEWQVLIPGERWDGRYCHGHFCKIYSAVS